MGPLNFHILQPSMDHFWLETQHIVRKDAESELGLVWNLEVEGKISCCSELNLLWFGTVTQRSGFVSHTCRAKPQRISLNLTPLSVLQKRFSFFRAPPRTAGTIQFCLTSPRRASCCVITLLCFDFNNFLVALERMISVFQVLLQAQKELLVYSDTGISVLGE